MKIQERYVRTGNEGRETGIMSFLTTILVFIVSFNKHFFNENKILIDLGFDGFKNYYTFGYYVRHGGGARFEGMAFPDGDSILFADAQPIISFFLSYLGEVFPWIHENTSLIVNILMAVGFGLGAYFIARILRDEGFDKLISVLFSVGIVFLSPQLFRMSLHHALAYPFIVPSVIWSFILMRRGDLSKIRFGLWIFLIGFIHLYYVLMCLIWLGGFYLIDYVMSKKVKLEEYLSFISPAILLFVIIKLSSLGLDRPEAPWGLFNFSGSLKDLFIPHTGCISTYLSETIPSWRTDYNEASSYIGVVGIIGLLSIITSQIKAHRKDGLSRDTHYLLSIIPIVMFGAQWPMSYFSEDFVQSIPILGQFRGTGRFFWLAYYVVAIFGIISLRNFLHSSVRQQVAFGIMILSSLFTLYEASTHIRNRIQVQAQYAGPDVFKGNKWISQALMESGLNDQKYQALITIPPSTTGSEKLWLYDNYHVKMVAWPYSWQTGTPMSAINLSRTPISTTLKSLALTCNEYSGDPDISGIPEGEYLVVVLNDVKPEYRYLLEKCHLVKENNQVTLYRISKEDLVRRNITHVDGPPGSISDSSRIISVHSFDQGNDKGILGNGLRVDGKSQWYSFPLDSASKGCLELAIWNQITSGPGEVLILNYRLLDSQGKVSSEMSLREFDAKQFEVYGNWVQMTHGVDISSGVTEISIQFQGSSLILDELELQLCEDLN